MRPIKIRNPSAAVFSQLGSKLAGALPRATQTSTAPRSRLLKETKRGHIRKIKQWKIKWEDDKMPPSWRSRFIGFAFRFLSITPNVTFLEGRIPFNCTLYFLLLLLFLFCLLVNFIILFIDTFFKILYVRFFFNLLFLFQIKILS